MELVALACSACGRANEPLTRWPVAVVLGSATERIASPAVEMTFALVCADRFALSYAQDKEWRGRL